MKKIQYLLIFMFLLSCKKYREQVFISNGLVAYYPFTGNAKDYSGNGNHGQVYGPVLAPDRFNKPNQCYEFDGISTYIKVNPSPGMFTNNYSISLWIYSYQDLCQKDVTILRSGNASDCGWQGFALTQFNYRANFGFADYGDGDFAYLTKSPCSVVKANKWYNLIYTRSGNSVSEYINGMKVNTETTGIYEPAKTCHLFIGSNHYLYENAVFSVFDGKIDDVRIYNRELTPTEIGYLALN